MCDRSNAKQIVAEMLSYLETADYSIREEMVCDSSSLPYLFSRRSLLKWVTVVSVGTEGCHPGREICSRLLLVCGHHSEPNPHCWGLRQWGSVVPRHPDRHQPWWCAGICSQDSLWGKWHQMFTTCPKIQKNWFPPSLRYLMQHLDFCSLLISTGFAGSSLSWEYGEGWRLHPGGVW